MRRRAIDPLASASTPVRHDSGAIRKRTGGPLKGCRGLFALGPRRSCGRARLERLYELV